MGRGIALKIAATFVLTLDRFLGAPGCGPNLLAYEAKWILNIVRK
jgi:hypothetical protein